MDIEKTMAQDFYQAKQLYEECHEQLKKVCGRESTEALSAMADRAMLHYAEGDVKFSKQDEEQAMLIKAGNGNSNSNNTTTDSTANTATAAVSIDEDNAFNQIINANFNPFGNSDDKSESGYNYIYFSFTIIFFAFFLIFFFG